MKRESDCALAGLAAEASSNPANNIAELPNFFLNILSSASTERTIALAFCFQIKINACF
jgi:hypothetical protein